MSSRAVIQSLQPSGVDLLTVPSELTELAEQQAGVVTRRQLRLLGFTPTEVETALDARRWRTFGRNVVVLQNAPLTSMQREWVAVLLPEKAAALAGPSAAAAGGLRGFESDQVHVLVPHDTHVRVPRWVKLHESRRFDTGDINVVARPPRTRTARAVIDAATWSRYPRRACAILCAAVQQRLVTAEQLILELRAAGHVRHVAIMRDILGDISGGGHTLAEIDLGRLALRAGLPAPRRQGLRREPDGKVRYLDAEFELPDGTVLAVEVDGAGHLEPETAWDDDDRQNEVVIGGQPMLRYPSLTIRLNQPKVIDQLSRMRLAHAV